MRAMLPVVALAVVVALAACGGGSGGSGDAVETAPRPAATDVAGVTLDGTRLALSELAGKPVFVLAFSYF